MSIRTILLTLSALGAAWGAQAQPVLVVRLPDVSGLSRPEAEGLMEELAEVSVITTNCPRWTIDEGAWALITGTGDRLAAQMGLDPATYDEDYYGPAFAALDDPSACDRIGPQARPLIARLEAMGGATTPAEGRRAGGRSDQADPDLEDGPPPEPEPDDDGTMPAE